MKRYFWLLCMFLFLLPFHSWAATPNLLILDQNQNRVAVIGSDLKLLNSYTAGPHPSELVPIPDGSGYLLMCRGSKNLLGGNDAPGELVYLDTQLKPTTKKIVLPGLIIKDFFLKNSATWIFFTRNKPNSPVQSPATVLVLDLRTGVDHRFDLAALPTTYQLNIDRSILALTTLGSTAKQIPAQLVLIDLHEFTLKSFPVSANPGGIYFMNEGKILVACGGFRNYFNYSSEVPIERFEKPVNAALHWIDTTTGNEQISKIGYSPLIIIQDQTDPNTFYAASSDTLYGKETTGTFRVLTNGEVHSEVQFAAEPVKLSQTKTGNICLLGRNEFYLINPKEPKIIANYNYQLTVDRLLLNSDETVGYLSAINSSNIDVIDLTSGNLIRKLKTSSSLLGGMLNLANLWPNGLPPVAGMIPPTSDLANNASDNNQVLMTTDFSRLYSLAGANEVSGIDVATTKKITSTKFFQGKPYGIHFTPNKNFVVVATDTTWYLLDPNQKKPVLSIPLFAGDYPPTTGYYSPDGSLLVIPSNGYYYFIDCQNGTLRGKVRTNIQNAIITWLP